MKFEMPGGFLRIREVICHAKLNKSHAHPLSVFKTPRPKDPKMEEDKIGKEVVDAARVY